jgi:hypothetical protein
MPARRAGGGGHGPAAEAAERRESGVQIGSSIAAKGRATIPLVPVPRSCCPVVVVVVAHDDDRQTPDRGRGDQGAVAHALLGSSNNDPFM